MISDVDTKQIVDNSFDDINSYMTNTLNYKYVSRSIDSYPYGGSEHKFHYRLLKLPYILTINLNRFFIVSFGGYLSMNDQTYLDNTIKRNQDILIRKKEIYKILND